jgi:hypothetical protein
MSKLTPEEEKKILESAPVGTWALMVALGVALSVGWLAMYFLRFLAHGPIN